MTYGICYPLHWAVRFNDIELLHLCIQRGDDINIKDHDENTPLHLSYLLGREDFIPILLNNGANHELLNLDKKKPSDYMM